jgi:hypothetical protein
MAIADFIEKIFGKRPPERRNYSRFPFRNIIVAKVIQKEKLVRSIEQAGLSKNLSQNGILFESNEVYPLHTLLQVDLDISVTQHARLITFIGEVARVEEVEEGMKYEYGVKFKKIPKKDEIVLMDFINQAGKDAEKKGFFGDKRKRSFLSNFFLSSGMSHTERSRGWFKIPSTQKKKIL